MKPASDMQPPSAGRPFPIGPCFCSEGTNFSLFSAHATSIELLFFDHADAPRPSRTIVLDPEMNRTSHYWHIFVPDIAPGQLYGFRVHGPDDPAQGHRFDSQKVLIDPYGKSIAVGLAYSRAAACQPGDTTATSRCFRDIADQKIAERALLQSEKLASVGRLASSIAHEINNPLASVTNLLYLLGVQVPTPELKALVAQAEEELARVSQITTLTLRFHRQSSNSTDLDIEKLFHSVVALYRVRLRNSSITTVIDRSRASHLRCREGELRQIVLNIFANAVDAMKHGGVLSIRCRESTNWANGQAGVRLIIADTGTGMDADILARIFELFFSTKGIGGTGLGLWVAEDLVEKNGGAMRVRSSKREESHGTTFSLFFPHTSEDGSACS